MSSNIISFSLWGSDPKYCIGAIRNVELTKEIYPDYKCRFYCGNSVPIGIIFQLEDLGAEIVEMDELDSYLGMFWRMKAINDGDVVLIRDCDSRLNRREKKYVDEWLKSNYLLTTIKDHPAHTPFYVMPGLMGFKKSDLDWDKLVKEFLKDRINNNHYGIDYYFYENIRKKIEKDILIFDVLNDNRQGLEFCGKVYDEKEETVLEHEKVLENWLRGRK